MSGYTKRRVCRGCLKGPLVKFLDLGRMPLAGAFLKKRNFPLEQLFPLSVYFCENCSLVQVLNVVPADILFEKYNYVSSVIGSLAKHFQEYAEFLFKEKYLPENGFIIEFGSNDGVLLQNFKKSEVKFLGIDPSKNVSKIARQRGIPTLTGYFNERIAQEILNDQGPADVITGSNVFAHTDDVHEIVKGAKVLLKLDGVFIVEVHYIVDLLLLNQYDTIYHEHMSYYSAHALKNIMEMNDLKIIDVTRTKMHGGAIRVISARRESRRQPRDSVKKILALENRMKLTEEKTYQDLGRFAKSHSIELRKLIKNLVKHGKTVSGYGAPGRGTILANYSKLTRDLVKFLVDVSPLRVSKYLPGVHIPIYYPDHLHKHPTDYSLVLAWNYRDQILSQEQEYLKKGGAFIFPFPKIEVVRGD